LKRIREGEARNSLKLGSISTRLNQEPSLTLPAEIQKKTVNPTLKGYRISCRVEA
jgi:hypothetical protein